MTRLKNYDPASLFGGKTIMQDVCLKYVKGSDPDRPLYTFGITSSEFDGIYTGGEYVLYDYVNEEFIRYPYDVLNQIEYSSDSFIYQGEIILCMRIMTYKNFEKYKYDKWSCFNYNTTLTFTLSIQALFPLGN
jgi:hypothetical protein